MKSLLFKSPRHFSLQTHNLLHLRGTDVTEDGDLKFTK